MTDKDIFGLDLSRSDNDINMDLHNNHYYSSICRECKSAIDPLIAEKIAKSLKDMKSFFKESIWLTGHSKD